MGAFRIKGKRVKKRVVLDFLQAQAGEIQRLTLEGRKLKMSNRFQLIWQYSLLTFVAAIMILMMVATCVGPPLALAQERTVQYLEGTVPRDGSLISPDDPIVRCQGNVIIKAAMVTKSITMPNKLVAVFYDTDRDAEGISPDIVAFHPILFFDYDPRTGEHELRVRRFAVFYHVDLDMDGHMDAVYQDKYGEGVCEDIGFAGWLDGAGPAPDKKEKEA